MLRRPIDPLPHSLDEFRKENGLFTSTLPPQLEELAKRLDQIENQKGRAVMGEHNYYYEKYNFQPTEFFIQT